MNQPRLVFITSNYPFNRIATKSIFNVVWISSLLNFWRCVIKVVAFASEMVGFLVAVGHVIIIPQDVNVNLNPCKIVRYVAQYKVNKFLINETLDVSNTNAVSSYLNWLSGLFAFLWWWQYSTLIYSTAQYTSHIRIALYFFDVKQQTPVLLMKTLGYQNGCIDKNLWFHSSKSLRNSK